MKKSIGQISVSVLFSTIILFSPVAAVAEPEIEQEVEPSESPSLIITELQTGNAARADEFIELRNMSNEPLDLSGWQLRYITASATSAKNLEDPSSIIPLVPPLEDDEAVTVPPGDYYVLYSGNITLPAGKIGQQYEGLLPATGGSVVLVRPDTVTCEFVVEDAFAWGNTTHLFGEGEALLPGSTSSNDKLYQRYIDTEGLYVDTDDNAHDFLSVVAAGSSGAGPGADNIAVLPELPIGGSGSQSQAFAARFTNADCTLPPDPDPPGDPSTNPPESPPSVIDPPEADPKDSRPIIPPGNIGLKAPILSELLPNPVSPFTDKDDEFIELYNPNDVAFDLSGYTLEVGLKTKKSYTIPAGTKLAPRTFLAFFSADTNLALSNSGSLVAFVDPLGRILMSSQAYGAAKEGQAWVLASGSWQWTTKPTPNALNIVSAPPAKASATKKVKSAASTKHTLSTAQPKLTNAQEDSEQVAATVSNSTPLHPGILAAIAIAALLYGAYEYRHDVANRLYQLRSNRAARRALRQSTSGE